MQPYIGYAFIVLTCILVSLVGFDKVKSKTYPSILYGIGAGLVLITTLAGPFLVGSDIHLDYYYAQLRAGREVIEPLVGIPQGTSIITYITDNIWIWKIVYPLLFAFVPVVLYYIFRRFLWDDKAFMGSFFFIIFPAFSMELPGIAKQMIAEVLLVLLIYLIFISSIKHKWVLIILCGILLPLIHYTIGVIAFILLVLGLPFKRTRKYVGIAIGIIIITSAIYFPLAEHGAVTIKLAHIWNSWTPWDIPAPSMTTPPFFKPEWAIIPPELVPPSQGGYENLLLSGLGSDFATTTLAGKIFRVLQWVLLGLIIMGIWKWRKNKEYWKFAGGGILLVGCLVLPQFSVILNSTRVLHLALFLLAPLIAVALKPKCISIILIVYFLFTSGFVFEVIRQDNVEQVTIPYSVGLSNYRLDLGASTNEEDKDVCWYITNNSLFPLVSDAFGTDFLGEFVGWRNDLIMALRPAPTNITGVYVFIRSRSIQEGYFVVWNGVGCKKYINPEDYYGINWNENIVYQSGEARLIWVP